LTDELYLFPVLDGSVHPLMRTASLARHEFFSADAAVRGRKNDTICRRRRVDVPAIW
jgi:hypothetical protein